MRLNPPRIYQGLILLMIVIYLMLPATRILAFPINLLGLPVFAGGAWLALAAKRQFIANKTPLAISSNTNLLHTGGVYRHTRNPMYLGIAAGLLGVALVFSSWVNLLFPPLFVMLMDRFFVAKEERTLHRQFGEEYEQFRSKVRRWL